MSNLAKVQKKMSIYAKRRVRNVLSGNYGSVFKGRSMDFDELRVYEFGDDVKDIDWKASARSKEPMIRRYIAIRKHNIMLVMDAGRNMAALTPSGETKSEIATFAAGVIAFIAIRNGDLVGMTFGDKGSNTRFPLKEGRTHAENILQKYEKNVKAKSEPSDINSVLNYVAKNYRERMFIFVITDEASASKISEDLLRKLRVRHEQMVIMVEDSDYTNPRFANDAAMDINSNSVLSKFIRKDRGLKKAEAAMKSNLREDTARKFRKLGICSCHIGDTEKSIAEIFKMLEEKKHVRR